MRVSTSGYHDWRQHKPSSRVERHKRIRQSVAQVYAQSQGIYGSYKIADQMQKRDDLEPVLTHNGRLGLSGSGVGPVQPQSRRPKRRKNIHPESAAEGLTQTCTGDQSRIISIKLQAAIDIFH